MRGYITDPTHSALPPPYAIITRQEAFFPVANTTDPLLQPSHFLQQQSTHEDQAIESEQRCRSLALQTRSIALVPADWRTDSGRRRLGGVQRHVGGRKDTGSVGD